MIGSGSNTPSYILPGPSETRIQSDWANNPENVKNETKEGKETVG